MAKYLLLIMWMSFLGLSPAYAESLSAAEERSARRQISLMRADVDDMRQRMDGIEDLLKKTLLSLEQLKTQMAEEHKVLRYRIRRG